MDVALGWKEHLIRLFFESPAVVAFFRFPGPDPLLFSPRHLTGGAGATSITNNKKCPSPAQNHPQMPRSFKKRKQNLGIDMHDIYTESPVRSFPALSKQQSLNPSLSVQLHLTKIRGTHWRLGERSLSGGFTNHKLQAASVFEAPSITSLATSRPENWLFQIDLL